MSEERKIQIVEEAFALFSKAGYGRMRVKELASIIGISEAAIYKYFSSKEEIYDAVLASIKGRVDLDSLFESIKEEEDIEVILRAIAENILVLYTEDQRATRLLLYSSLEGHALARKVFDAVRIPYVEFLAKKISKLSKAGILQDVNPIITARCFVGMVFDCSLNLNLWKGMAGKPYQPNMLINNNIPIYVRGLIK